MMFFFPLSLHGLSLFTAELLQMFICILRSENFIIIIITSNL